jgi:hypothetical protein
LIRRIVALTAVLAALAIFAVAQSSNPSSSDQDRDRDSMQSSQAAQPTAGGSSASAAVEITNGPGADKITDSSAEIFWNTSAPASSVVRYGTSPNQLDQKSESSSGQADDHKVELTNLQSKTQYYFQVGSGESQDQGTTTEVKSGIGTFTTE